MQKNAQNERYLTLFTLKKICLQKGQTPKRLVYPSNIPKINAFYGKNG